MFTKNRQNKCFSKYLFSSGKGEIHSYMVAMLAISLTPSSHVLHCKHPTVAFLCIVHAQGGPGTKLPDVNLPWLVGCSSPRSKNVLAVSIKYCNGIPEW